MLITQNDVDAGLESKVLHLYIDSLKQKTAVTPLRTHWSYYSLALSHPYDICVCEMGYKMSFEMWSSERRSFCLGLHVLNM